MTRTPKRTQLRDMEGIRQRAAALLERLPKEAQFPTQGRSVFLDLEAQTVAWGYSPLPVVETFLEGRGANFFYLYNLMDESLDRWSPGKWRWRYPGPQRARCQ